nr:MFS general substrate transporter [Aspergillus sp.]
MGPEKSSISHVEDGISPVHNFDQPDSATKGPVLITDSNGLPLIPQPSSHKDDPLNWPAGMKLWITLQVSWLALLSTMGAAAPNPAFVLMGEHFTMHVPEISHELTVFLVFAGVGPLLTSPFAKTYGRRPIYLLGAVLAGVTNIAAGYCDNWAGIMITRVFNGFGAGATIALGAATICDMYFTHQRGLHMGIYTFAITNGAHVAPILGGYVAHYLDWRACFYIPGYIQTGTAIVLLFCLPETLYTARTSGAAHREQSYLENLMLRHNHVPGHWPAIHDFLRPFKMLRFVVIILTSCMYMACFGYGSVLFAFTGAKLFSSIYGFTTTEIGLMLSVPLLIGCLIGELGAGWVVDWASNRYAKRHNGERLPEARLDVLWGTLLVPIGIIIEGCCLAHPNVHWVGSAFGMGLASLGLQIGTTVVYSYLTDCYRAQSAEVSTILNVFRQIFSCFISFYALVLPFHPQP